MDINSTVKLNNGVEMPIFGLGTWMSSDEEAENAVIDAVKAGYRHIDTAAIYKNEAGVGRGIKNCGVPRKDLFIVTKLWNSDHHDVEKAFNESLKNLQLDYVDLYLMHFPVPERQKSWKVMEKLLESKKCRAIGVSNFTIRHLEEFLPKTSVIPAVNQVEFHPYLYQKHLHEFCIEKGIQLEAYSPVTRGKKLDDPLLVGIAKRYNKTPAQILIRWCIEHKIVVIPKSANPQRIKENGNVFDFKIQEDDMKELDSINENFRICWDPTNAP